MNARRILSRGWLDNALSVLTFGYYGRAPITDIAVGKLCIAVEFSIPTSNVQFNIPTATMLLNLPATNLAISVPSSNVELTIPSATIIIEVTC